MKTNKKITQPQSATATPGHHLVQQVKNHLPPKPNSTNITRRRHVWHHQNLHWYSNILILHRSNCFTYSHQKRNLNSQHQTNQLQIPKSFLCSSFIPRFVSLLCLARISIPCSSDINLNVLDMLVRLLACYKFERKVQILSFLIGGQISLFNGNKNVVYNARSD